MFFMMWSSIFFFYLLTTTIANLISQVSNINVPSNVDADSSGELFTLNLDIPVDPSPSSNVLQTHYGLNTFTIFISAGSKNPI